MPAGDADRATPADRRCSRRRAPTRAAAGFTLIELLAVLAVVALLTVVAGPSYNESRVRARVNGVANNLQSDLQYARSEAVQRNARVWVSFATGTAWCYGIHQGGAACDCSVANACNIKVVNSTLAASTGVTMSGASFGGNAFYAIDPRRGQLVDAAGAPVTGAITVTGSGSQSLRAEVNAVGRARLCSPSSSMGGYPAC